MQQQIGKINASGLTVVGVSYDSVEVLKKFSDKRMIGFPLLSDPDSQTIVSYAIRNKETAGKGFGTISLDGVPYPGTFIVDQQGIIRAKLFVDGYKDRHSVEELIRTGESIR